MESRTCVCRVTRLVSLTKELATEESRKQLAAAVGDAYAARDVSARLADDRRLLT